ncbi:MAG: DUF3298 domain-containing protein, partial [Thermotogaceae bacterium]|nr:DUF3298 domain-containing protein [Thermotogaceae bacterium]
ESTLLNQVKIYKKGITSGRPEYYLVFSVERLDSKIVSILFEEMTYTGGAHPIHFLHAINYDLKYGKELALNDLFVKGFDCKKIINEEVKKFFERNKCSVINDFKTIKNEQDFYLTDYGIMIFFQRYEYTNYSFGNPKIPIPYGRFGRFFKKEYLP